MPAKSERQRRFFSAVKGAKRNPNAPQHLRKVADSMSDKDIDDFIKCESEFKTKKAILSVLKDIVEPMYLNEDIDGEPDTDVVTNTFHVKGEWAKYIKPYVGQPLSSKELEALQNFKEKQPTTIARTEIWYNSTDQFGMSKTCVIKKMKDAGQFSFTAFQKQETPTPEEEKSAEDQEDGAMGMAPPEMPQPGDSSTPPTSEPPEQEEKAEKDDIIVTKSILFKNDIKGASILVDFLKKLDL
jgi:hypothetical protein